MKLTIEIKDDKKAEYLFGFLKAFGIDYIKKGASKKNSSIPDWHIAIAQQRLADYKKNPKNTLDFDSAIDEIEKDL